jgi:hypothetical protein
VYSGDVERSVRLNVTLDAEHAAKLERLARRTYAQEGSLARSLLSRAIDEADPDASDMTELLDSIPGAFEAAERGRQQADRGEVIPLDLL